MAPTPNQLPDSSQSQEGEYNYQAPSTNPGSSQHYVPPMAYHPQSTYYSSTSMPYLHPVPQRGLAQAPYSYQQYSSPVPVPSTTELAEPTHSTSSYAGSYDIQNQPPIGSQRSDPYYYSQSAGAPVTPTTESSYGHQFMAFRQTTHPAASYTETNQVSPSLPSPSTHSSQRLTSPERPADEQRARSVDEVNYGSIANSYRYIAAAVSQASPSPSTDSSGQSFDPPVVEDMYHRAVEGLRHLDPSRAEQYYPSESTQPIASGAVAAEAPAETVFVRYYEDGKTEGNPMKKKRERKGATQCASCHATSTPEWRRGPLGPRTLCNACGLVYAKLMKKRAKEEDKLSPGGSPRRARSKGKTRAVTEESEEDRGTEQGSDDTLPPTAGPSGALGGGYPS